MAEQHSKFVAFFQNDATPQNKKPSLKGNLKLPSGEEYSFPLWAGEQQGGKGLYLNGQLTPSEASSAIRQQLGTQAERDKVGVAPPALTLDVGHIVLFETPAESLAENPKRPKYYGYAHTIEGYFRIGAWEGTTNAGAPMIRGSIDVNDPAAAANNNPAPQPSIPPKDSRVRAPRAGQGTT